jgi:hypothetical protein
MFIRDKKFSCLAAVIAVKSFDYFDKKRVLITCAGHRQ